MHAHFKNYTWLWICFAMSSSSLRHHQPKDQKNMNGPLAWLHMYSESICKWWGYVRLMWSCREDGRSLMCCLPSSRHLRRARWCPYFRSFSSGWCQLRQCWGQAWQLAKSWLGMVGWVGTILLIVSTFFILFHSFSSFFHDQIEKKSFGRTMERVCRRRHNEIVLQMTLNDLEWQMIDCASLDFVAAK